MIEEAEAYQLLQEKIVAPSRVERVALELALGCVAAETVTSVMSMPRFANAMVDGYALPEGNHDAGARFEVVGEQAAGRDGGLQVGEEQAVRIFTGAPLPNGTGSVIMQEVVRREGGILVIEEAIAEGKGFRREGDDLCEGQLVLSVGDRLDAQKLALLVSQGMVDVAVRPSMRAHVISTGDELKAPGEPLVKGELYESNAAMLCLLGEQHGFAGWTREHVVDDPEKLRVAIEAAARTNDFLFLSGGVSVGDHDHVRRVLTDLEMQEHFWRVRVQPGKPVLFGSLGECQVLGLPGNPVSSFVSFHLFGMPALHHWMGIPVPQRERAALVRATANSGKRPHYLRGRYDPVERTFDSVGLQKSHGMLGLSKANGLARVPADASLEAGDEVEVLRV